MSEKDFTVTITGVPSVGGINKKPSYLITLEDTSGKNKNQKRFITNDKPDFNSGFVQVKGIFSDLPEDEILKKFSELLTSCPKELILDIMFPVHKICSIRSLVFNANKPQTLVK